MEIINNISDQKQKLFIMQVMQNYDPNLDIFYVGTGYSNLKKVKYFRLSSIRTHILSQYGVTFCDNFINKLIKFSKKMNDMPRFLIIIINTCYVRKYLHVGWHVDFKNKFSNYKCLVNDPILEGLLRSRSEEVPYLNMILHHYRLEEFLAEVSKFIDIAIKASLFALSSFIQELL